MDMAEKRGRLSVDSRVYNANVPASIPTGACQWRPAMCKAEDANEVEQRAFCYFWFFVYRVYREARHIPKYCNNPMFGPGTEQYEALSSLDGPGGMHELAKLYCQVVGQKDVPGVEAVFVERTKGLTLLQLHDDFAGDWQDPSRTLIGGHKW